VRLEGLNKLKKCNDLIGNQTHGLPACRIADGWLEVLIEEGKVEVAFVLN
jgi:hypothetical protein